MNIISVASAVKILAIFPQGKNVKFVCLFKKVIDFFKTFLFTLIHPSVFSEEYSF
jgi:hypothetical protein